MSGQRKFDIFRKWTVVQLLKGEIILFTDNYMKLEKKNLTGLPGLTSGVSILWSVVESIWAG